MICKLVLFTKQYKLENNYKLRFTLTHFKTLRFVSNTGLVDMYETLYYCKPGMMTTTFWVTTYFFVVIGDDAQFVCCVPAVTSLNANFVLLIFEIVLLSMLLPC